MKRWITAFCVCPLFCIAQAEPVSVAVDPSTVRNIGGVSAFDRDQYITIHESIGVKKSNDPFRDLLEELEVSYGRDGGTISSAAKRTPADPHHPDMPDVDALEKACRAQRDKARLSTAEAHNEQQTVLCTHPERMHATPNNNYAPWGPRTYEGVAEFTAQFLRHRWSDEERPRYLEVLNEPFVHAREIGTTVEAMSEQHNVVAKRVRELNPDVLVGGYTAAWVEVESRNFAHWSSWQKTFMDIAGQNMDFFSYHIYDGVNVMGSERNRTGSNSEAIMDLIDSYSFIKFGIAKPLLISEYGKIPKGGMESSAYSSERSAQMLRTLNGQLMTFMDHPDRLLKTIPFIMEKGLWTYGLKNEVEPGHANPFLLLRRTETGDFVETDLTKFYQFWKGVQGEWRKSSSSNPDVRVHLLAADRQMTLAMTNLDIAPQEVQLTGMEKCWSKSVVLRSLRTDGETPVLTEEALGEMPESILLAPGQSVLLFAESMNRTKISNQIVETRCYASEYMKDIVADQSVHFEYQQVPIGSGNAVLRISAGRELGRQALPSSVCFNGQELSIPTNWAGDDQSGRAMFFGMIEVVVPMELVHATNELKITYPDTGGKVACAVLQVNIETSL